MPVRFNDYNNNYDTNLRNLFLENIAVNKLIEINSQALKLKKKKKKGQKTINVFYKSFCL